MKDSEFKIPFPNDPRKADWWWEHDYGGERQLRLECRKRARERSREHGVPVPRHVYFLACDAADLIKIGSAFDIELRVEQLRTLSPMPVRIVGWVLYGGEQMERQLHRRFRARRSHGEWFRVSHDELRAAAEDLITGAS